jgi:hypothetical protein
MDPEGVLVAEGKEHPLRHALSIGRDPENAIALRSKTVSRRHARLTFVQERWLIEDLGSANGTFVNGEQVPFGAARPLRHGDRIAVGAAKLVFSWPAEREDPDRTEDHDALPAGAPSLSSFQLQVVRALCGAWVSGDPVDTLPTNAQIAASLGTPDADGAVKAALRRIYVKTGLTELPAHAKRRALCRIARTEGWL